MDCILHCTKIRAFRKRQKQNSFQKFSGGALGPFCLAELVPNKRMGVVVVVVVVGVVLISGGRRRGLENTAK